MIQNILPTLINMKETKKSPRNVQEPEETTAYIGKDKILYYYVDIKDRINFGFQVGIGIVFAFLLAWIIISIVQFIFPAIFAGFLEAIMQ